MNIAEMSVKFEDNIYISSPDNRITVDLTALFLFCLSTCKSGIIRYIYDENGDIVVTYEYDAWGRQLSVTGTEANTTGQANPYRYKDYYCDEETGFYYLQSRYYDPNVGRFISPDSVDYLGASGSTQSWNLFAYCENEPVELIDPTGYKAINITSKLLNLMRSNALKFAYYILTQILLKGVARGFVKSFEYFYNNSKTGGAWDLKQLREWKLKEGDWFVFKGIKLRSDDPGNIHFGYVGSVMFPDYILRAGAGVYQIYSGTSKWSFWWTLYDDPRDSSMIEYGNILFRADFIKTIIKILAPIKKINFYWLH